MIQRKSLSKKIRFEVFKRDNFTCQYCGSKAPNVILEVDHLKPVKEGGTNDIMNLVTSCFNCNRGKGKRVISDLSIVEKQRLQIEELNIKRQQLEMMLEWREGLVNIKDDEQEKAIDYWNKKIAVIGSSLSEYGEKELIKLVKKYGLFEVLDTIDLSIDKYPLNNLDDVNSCFKKIGGILNLKNKPDHIKKMAYIKGICRNKFNYFNEKKASISLHNYYNNGGNLDELEFHLKNGYVPHWSKFIEYLEG